MHISVDTEFKSLIFPLTTDEYAQLEKNIIKDECLDPLKVWNGLIVDGHNRHEICTRHDLPFNVVEMQFKDRGEAVNWIIDNQLGRRNLAPWQQSILRGKRYNAVKTNGHGAKPGYQNDTQKTRETLADQYGVSPATIQRDGEFAKAAEHAEEERGIPAMQLTKKIILDAAKGIREERQGERRAERIEKLTSISSNNAPLQSEKKYNVILCDPPWRYEHSVSTSRDIENQYPTMSHDEICAMPVSDVASSDCVLFMWATSPKLKEAMQVIEAWGFDYRTNGVWVKDKIGMGYYFRQQHELLLIATRGNVPAPLPEARVSSIIESPRTEHSKKPDEVYEIIERMYTGLPMIELFSRNKRQGWDNWGNQA